MADSQSKVTRRPRSRLERLVSALDAVTPRALVRDPLEVVRRGSARDEILRLLDPKTVVSPHELRARLGALGISDRALVDELLLRAGKADSVAPTSHAMRVVVRLGYPGDTYDSVARALDAELPGSNAGRLALRAHDLLDAHGRAICLAVGPVCKQCRIAERCDYHGEGPDPATRLRLRVVETP